MAVTDVDELGSVALPATRTRRNTALAATLSDPDGVTAGTESWKWERSTGPNAWTAIDGATSSTYTPSAGDTNTFLRVTATYDDEHGTSHTAEQVTAEVVLGPLLTSLTVTTQNATDNSAHALRPAFDDETLHYGIGCDDSDEMTITAVAATGVRLAVNGSTVTSGSAVSLPVSGDTTVPITLWTSDGAQTRYVVQCMPAGLLDFIIVQHTTNPTNELFILTKSNHLVVMDANGAPRLVHPVNPEWRLLPFGVGVFRVGNDGQYRYSYALSNSNRWVNYTVLNEDFEPIARVIRTLPPLNHTDGHDFTVLPNGDYLMLAYNSATRDLSHLPWLETPPTEPVPVNDSVVHIRTPSGNEVFTWNSWGNIPLEDCVQHRFPVQNPGADPLHAAAPGYAHVNSARPANGQIVTSLRGCSAVLAIDVATGRVAWRVGNSNLSNPDWEARNLGPAPMDFINDPEREFCGQHTASILPNGNLLMFDNGVPCVINPWTNELLGRTGGDFSRGLEYALDFTNNEAVFVRDHSLRGTRDKSSRNQGHIEELENGDWLISWGRPPANTVFPGSGGSHAGGPQHGRGETLLQIHCWR